MKKNNADIKVLFKTLGAGKTISFDELGYEFFNTDGSPDVTVATSLSQFDFQEYTIIVPVLLMMVQVNN